MLKLTFCVSLVAGEGLSVAKTLTMYLMTLGIMFNATHPKSSEPTVASSVVAERAAKLP